MAFRELAQSLQLPDGASDRYRRLEALERMLTGEIYDDLKWSFDQEKIPGKNYIPLRERRPSVDFCLAYEITQDTLAELFGDEQFPTVQVMQKGEQNEAATKALADAIDEWDLEKIVSDAYENGVVGSVGVVVQRSDDGTPYYDVLPGKWCEPVYRSKVSNELVALIVTLPIDAETAEELAPGITEEDKNRGAETFWYRYVVGPIETLDYIPMADHRFAKLGEIVDGERVEFKERGRAEHGFKGRTPAIYVKNLGGRQRELDGPALWWPIRNICIEIDYTLSQAGRGLRYAADPMLFVRKGEIANGDTPAGYEAPMGGMSTQNTEDGSPVRGVTNSLVGYGSDADAKLLEISAAGIAEEREYVRDLREYALEVLGGMKARAEHLKAAPSGAALDKGLKPLRRLVRRQRRPYGRGALLGLIDLTLYGISVGALEPPNDTDVSVIPLDAKRTNEWPNDDVLQGQELLFHVEGLQMAAGGSPTDPIQLIKPKVMGAKLASDLGMHEPYAAIAGTGEQKPDPVPGPIPGV